MTSGPENKCTQRGCIIGEEPKLTEPKSFIVGSQHASPLLQGKTLSSSSASDSTPALRSGGRNQTFQGRSLDRHSRSESMKRSHFLAYSAEKRETREGQPPHRSDESRGCALRASGRPHSLYELPFCSLRDRRSGSRESGLRTPLSSLAASAFSFVFEPPGLVRLKSV